MIKYILKYEKLKTVCDLFYTEILAAPPFGHVVVTVKKKIAVKSQYFFFYYIKR